MRPYLKIKNPCEESPENMHEIPEGKFCDLCSKKVIDFSDLNNSEISKIVAENRDEKICGFFYKSPFKHPVKEVKEIPAYSEKKSFSAIAAGLALTAGIISSYPAQTKHPVKKELLASTKSAKQNDREKTKTDEGNFIISGTVISSDKQKPIPATVSFVTILKVYTTQTDKDGNYSLEVPKKILKYESLLEFSPEDYIYDRKLAIYTIENLGKKQSVGLDYNGLDKMMGDIVLSPPNATEKSLVILDGKKIDPELFNQSYWMHYKRYDLYYIPREFVKFFTDKESIKDIYLVFVKTE